MADITAINGSTFGVVPKDDPLDRVSVEIGDAKQADFYPQVKAMRWDNEVNFSLRLISPTAELTPAISLDQNKVTWAGVKTQANFYQTTDGEGGFEFEVVLQEEPPDKTIRFSLESKGLVAYYQPFFDNTNPDGSTWETRPSGVVTSPEDVGGSYALYYVDHPVNYTGEKIYRTGKFGHILRPRIVDAEGKKVWGKLSLDIPGKSMGITWEEDLTYPITIDPNIGYVTEGANHENISGNYAVGSHAATDASGGTTDLIHIAIFEGADASRYYNCAMYNDGSGLITTKLAATVAKIIPGNGVTGFVTGAYVQALAASTTYWLAMTGSSTNLGIKYDDGADNIKFYKNIGGVTLPATMVTANGYGNEVYSIYASYAAAGGVTIPTITETLNFAEALD